ncbi:MAG: hypothetical protein R2762_10510 [Bryobacteraceae bacterium]
MSVQIFLQGKLVGIEKFAGSEVRPDAEGNVPGEAETVVGRCRWIGMLSEVLPRAVLAELGLARILLGWSGGGGFFLVLPQENLEAACELLDAADRDVRRRSGGLMRLAYGWTENLGDWLTVRKRLNEAVFRAVHTDSETRQEDYFRAHDNGDVIEDAVYFRELSESLREAKSVGWDSEAPGRVAVGGGKHQWPVGSGEDGIAVMRYAAPSGQGSGAASPEEMAAESEGLKSWGVLRGDVDGFAPRMRRVQSVEDYVQLSVLYRQFLAGELEIQCSLADYWRRVTVLYTGGDDFAVYGAWDALLGLGREMQRLFQRFSEVHLQELPGPEGKTITMALELAGEGEGLAAVYARAGRSLEIAKNADRDCVRFFGATVEWRQMQHTGQLKDILLRMVREFRMSATRSWMN